MKTHHLRLRRNPFAPILSLGLVALLATAGAAYGASGLFVQMQSHRSFNDTVSALKHAVSKNGMSVMGHINQANVLSMSGLHLEGGESFLVGNPEVGKKLFRDSPAAGAVLPLRIYVWEAGGESHIGYFKPSTLLGAINPQLQKPGQTMDAKFHRIVSDATQ